MSRKSIYYLGIVGLLILLVHPFTLAQLSRATISGTVTDETGGVLPGVSITIENLEMGTTRETVADDQGRYSAPNLSVGSYSVRAELPGFSIAVRTGIQLTVGRNAIVNLALQVGEITEQVTVTGEAPLVDTTSSSVGGIITQSVIEDLPLNGRSFDELARLIPGVTRGVGSDGGFQGGFTQGMSIRGARIEHNKMLLDGTDVQGIDNQLPGSVAGVTLGVESIREFKVEVGTYGAEYGRALGGVINVSTKSGSNEFHGSLFTFHRNDNLDAANWVDNRTGSGKPEFKRNQFGGSIGGPIIPNQTFFFGSYEGLRDRLGNVLTSVVPFRLPSDPNTVIFSDDGETETAIPLMEPYLALYPFPNSSDPSRFDFGDGTGERVDSLTEPTNEDFFTVRIDHTLSQSDSLFVTYTFDDGEQLGSGGFKFLRTPQVNRNQFVTIEETRVFSPSLFNTIHFGFSRNYKALEPAVVEGQPEADPSLAFVPGFRVEDSEIINDADLETWGVADKPRAWGTGKWQLSDQVVLTRGNHSLKFGGEGIRFHANFHQNSNNGGEYRFADIPNFLEGKADRFRLRLPGTSQSRSARTWYGAWYIQDNIQLLSNLNVNLGLRHEIHSGVDEVHDRCANLDDLFLPPRLGCPLFEGFHKNFSPRIGFAWDFTGTGKSALRGGFGVYFSEFSGSSYYTPMTNQFPLSIQADFRNPPFPDALASFDTVDPTLRTRPIRATDLPYTLQFSLTLQQELLTNLTLSVGYAGTLGRHWITRGEENITPWMICPAAPECAEFGRPDGVKFFPDNDEFINNEWRQVRVVTTDVNTSYHGLLLEVRQRFTAGVSFQGSYTLAKSMDTLPYTTSGNVVDFYDKGAFLGLSDSDLRHNLGVGATWDLPGPADGAAKMILGGWQVGGILSLSSGSPLSPQTNTGRSNDKKGSRQEHPDLAAGFSNNPTSGVSAGCTFVDTRGNETVIEGGPLGVPERWFDFCAFEFQPEGFYGNLGRNTVIGPGLASVDFSLHKNIDLSEETRLQFRAEFFNIANRPNFRMPDEANVFRSRGRISASSNVVEDTRTTARQIQFGLKLYF